MCFTPAISFSTAIIEFFTAIIILVFFKKSRVNLFFTIFLFALGFYQISEFMLCTSLYPMLWAKAGFIIYTLLPAMGLYSTLRIIDRDYKSHKLALLYAPAVFFILTAVLNENFIVYASCNEFFVEVGSMLYDSSFLFAAYLAYYFGFLILICIFLYLAIIKEKNKIKKKIEIAILVAVIITLLPAIVLILIFPSLNKMFPSIYCEFAILFAITALISAYLDRKPRKRY